MNGKECKACKGEGKLYSKTTGYTNTGKPIRHEYICEDCGGTGRVQGISDRELERRR